MEYRHHSVMFRPCGLTQTSSETYMPIHILQPFRLLLALATMASVLIAVAPSATAIGQAVDIAAVEGGHVVLLADGEIDATGTEHLGNSSVDDPMAIFASDTGDGYLVAGAAGEVEVFGTATHHGDLDHIELARDVIAMAVTPSGNGYWLVGADGGVFSFGDAPFLGSMAGIRLTQPVVGIASTPTGAGYWLVASDGGVFAFGDAMFLGSMGGVPLDQPIIGLAADPAGTGYSMIARDGGVFSFGDAAFHGSIGGTGRSDIVALSPTPTGAGYVIVGVAGDVVGFGDGDRADAAPAEATPIGGQPDFATDLLDRINADRAARGAPALRLAADLSAIATEWSHYMAASHNLHHSDLGAQLSRLDDMGSHHYALAENIYWGGRDYATPAAAHQWFMGSSGHRTNAMSATYTEVGLGIACVNGVIWVTELFGRPIADGRAPQVTPAPQQPRVDLSDRPSPSC